MRHTHSSHPSRRWEWLSTRCKRWLDCSTESSLMKNSFRLSGNWESRSNAVPWCSWYIGRSVPLPHLWRHSWEKRDMTRVRNMFPGLDHENIRDFLPWKNMTITELVLHRWCNLYHWEPRTWLSGRYGILKLSSLGKEGDIRQSAHGRIFNDLAKDMCSSYFASWHSFHKTCLPDGAAACGDMIDLLSATMTNIHGGLKRVMKALVRLWRPCRELIWYSVYVHDGLVRYALLAIEANALGGRRWCPFHTTTRGMFLISLLHIPNSTDTYKRGKL